MGTTFHIVSFDKSGAVPRYEGRTGGYNYFSLVDDTVGSVHIGKGVGILEPGGFIPRHLHSYEEAFYVLEGTVSVAIGDRAYTLVPGDYGFFPLGVEHAWVNVSNEPVRWLEVCAGQPLPADDPRRDTFFTGAPLNVEGARRIDLNDVRDRYVGHWENMSKVDEISAAMPIGMDLGCINPSTGVYVKRLVCDTLGASLVQLIMCEFAELDGPVHRTTHDHTFEESFFILEGEVEGTINTDTYRLHPGDGFWMGVGTQHGWENVGKGTVRWLEAQCPQPPLQHTYRHTEQWRKLGEKIDAEAAETAAAAEARG